MDEIKRLNDTFQSSSDITKELQFSINFDVINRFTEQMRSFSKIQEETFEPMQKAMQIIQKDSELFKSIQTLQSSLSSINDNLKDSFSGITKAATTISTVFSSAISQEFAKQQEQFGLMFQRMNESMREFQKILFSLGWFPLGDWDVRHERHILELYKEKRIKEIDRFMHSYYTKSKTLSILEKWRKNKRLKCGRYKILKSAVNSHLRREYTLSIIVLLTQIEGEIRELLKEKGKADYHQLLKKYKTRIKADVVMNTLEDSAVEGVCDGILVRIFHNHGVKKKTGKITFSRNSIIHGINLRDYNRTESMKLILLMNYIISREFLI